jgi:hypothetical protein
MTVYKPRMVKGQALMTAARAASVPTKIHREERGSLTWAIPGYGQRKRKITARRNKAYWARTRHLNEYGPSKPWPWR